MFHIHFNLTQRKEFAKALFNSGNLALASLVLEEVVAGRFDAFIFLIGAISFASFFTVAIILLKNERNEL